MDEDINIYDDVVIPRNQPKPLPYSRAYRMVEFRGVRFEAPTWLDVDGNIIFADEDVEEINEEFRKAWKDLEREFG